MNFIKNYFYNKRVMSEKEYTAAKVCFTIESIAANSAANIAAGSYIVALLAYMGASEVISNFVSSFSLYAGFFVILAPYITANLVHKKPFVYLCRFFDRLPVALAFLVPVILGKTTISIILVAALALLRSVMEQIVSPAYNQWYMNCISGGNPAKFCGLKDGIVNATQIATFFAMSLLTKHFVGDREGAVYTVIATVALILWGVEMLSLTYIKEPYCPPCEKRKVNVLRLLSELVNFKAYKFFLPFTVLYNMAINLSGSLIAVYRVQRLGMSLEMSSYLMMTDLIIRSVMSYVFGRVAAKTGERYVMAIGTAFIALYVGLHTIMNGDNMAAMVLLVALFGGIGYGAYNFASFVYLFKCLPEHNVGEYFACHNVITLGIGSVASLAATCFIGIAKGFEVNLFGFNLSEMRIVILVSAVLMIICSAILVTGEIKKRNKNTRFVD